MMHVPNPMRSGASARQPRDGDAGPLRMRDVVEHGFDARGAQMDADREVLYRVFLVCERKGLSIDATGIVPRAFASVLEND
jgi:hypothetical protein